MPRTIITEALTGSSAERHEAVEHRTGHEHDAVSVDATPHTTWAEVEAYLPRDDSGYQITPRDAEFIGITPENVANWHAGDAPLGMTPPEYERFRTEMSASLRRDGVELAAVDARLQGSSAKFFSNPTKRFPSPDVIAVSYSDHPNRSVAEARLAEWRQGDSDYPGQRPFDSMYKLGLEEYPSDYDIQFSSDAMVERAYAAYQKLRSENTDLKPFVHPKYGFILKEAVRLAFPELKDWVTRTQEHIQREVAVALFASSGPADKSGTEPVSAHFRDTDWMIVLDDDTNTPQRSDSEGR